MIVSNLFVGPVRRNGRKEMGLFAFSSVWGKLSVESMDCKEQTEHPIDYTFINPDNVNFIGKI